MQLLTDAHVVVGEDVAHPRAPAPWHVLPRLARPARQPPGRFADDLELALPGELVEVVGDLERKEDGSSSIRVRMYQVLQGELD